MQILIMENEVEQQISIKTDEDENLNDVAALFSSAYVAYMKKYGMTLGEVINLMCEGYDVVMPMEGTE